MLLANPSSDFPVSYGKMQSGEISTSEPAQINRPTNSSLTVCPGLGVWGTSPEAERERERDSIMKHHHITGQCISKPQESMLTAAVWLVLAVSGERERERTDSASIRTAAVRYQSHTPNTSAHIVLQKWATPGRTTVILVQVKWTQASVADCFYETAILWKHQY